MSNRKRRNFSNEFKEEAVKLISVQGYTIAEAARNLGVHATQLSRWKKEIAEPSNVDGLGNMTEMQAELKLLRRNHMKSSMSRKGDCWDNSVAESFLGTLKTEQVFDTVYKTREEARRDIVDYIEMFTTTRCVTRTLVISVLASSRKW